MNTNTLSFPSGRTVERCRQDAKALVKSSKLTDSPITLNTALDRVSSVNGINSPWSRAIEKLIATNIKKPKIAQTHLLGHALDLLIKKELIDMNSTIDAGDGYLECDLLGKPSVINWSYISHGEIRLSVWWNFDKTKHPQHLEGGYKNKVVLDTLPTQEKTRYLDMKRGVYSNSVESFQSTTPLANSSKYINFVGVLCSAWVERKDGKHLQLKDGKHILDSYIRSRDKKALCSIPDCKPLGFELTGRFYM